MRTGHLLNTRSLPAAYEYLRSTPPFHRWNMPHADHVVFLVISRPDFYGVYTRVLRTKDHEIQISIRRVGTTETLIETMAHEMVHLSQDQDGTDTPGAEHNADFWRRWRIVSRFHGFDPKAL